jgi:hypothetical protein
MNEFPYSYPQSDRSYSRERGRVSIFDLRPTSDDPIEKALSGRHFFNPQYTVNTPIFLTPSGSLYPPEISWMQVQDENGWTETVMPQIEASHEGDLPVSGVSSANSVTGEKLTRQPSGLQK